MLKHKNIERIVSIPLVGSLTKRTGETSTAKDQVFINCFPEITQNKLTNTSGAQLTKRTGFAATAATTAGNIARHGCLDVQSISTNYSLFAFDNTSSDLEIWSITAGSKAQVGSTITTDAGCTSITETILAGVTNFVVIASGGGAAYFFPIGGAWTQIIDADFPTEQGTPLVIAGDPVHMDGYMFVLTTSGLIYNSDLNSLANWSATNYLSAQSSPDIGVGLARYKKYIVAFGTNSIEFFENVGNATGSPLAVVKDATINLGAYYNSNGGRQILQVGETIYWISHNSKTSKVEIYQLENMQPKKISTAMIDNLLTMGTNDISHIVGAISLNGKQHILFNTNTSTSTSAAITYAYCIESDFWWIFQSSEIFSPVACVSGGLPANNNNMVCSGTSIAVPNPKIYYNTGSTPLWKDNSVAYTMTVQTDRLDFDTTHRKFVRRMRVEGDTQSATSNLGVSWSDDDYTTFSTARNIDLSLPDKELPALGSHKYGRAYKFTHAANTDCRIKNIELLMDIGIS